MYLMVWIRLKEYWMKYNPHSYQEYTTNFIMNNPIAAILLDMGMGKTSIVLGRFIGQYREAYFNGAPYENLANAIVLSAVEDYRKALRRLSKNPESKSARADVDSLERFFQIQLVFSIDFHRRRVSYTEAP